jgi:hypothetical protein
MSSSSVSAPVSVALHPESDDDWAKRPAGDVLNLSK